MSSSKPTVADLAEQVAALTALLQQQAAAPAEQAAPSATDRAAERAEQAARSASNRAHKVAVSGPFTNGKGEQRYSLTCSAERFDAVSDALAAAGVDTYRPDATAASKPASKPTAAASKPAAKRTASKRTASSKGMAAADHEWDLYTAAMQRIGKPAAERTAWMRGTTKTANRARVALGL